MKAPISFDAHTDIVIIGSDPEAADYDNPRGNIYGFTSSVIATFKDGRRVAKTVKTSPIELDAFEPAERLASALTNRLYNLKKLPVAFDTWHETYPVYGSDAHDEQELIEWERRIDEDSEVWGY